MELEVLFDKATWTLTYVVYDESTKDAVIIDPVLDYDQPSSTLSTDSMEKLCDFLQSKDLIPHYILETHAHADHVSSSHQLKQRYPQLKVAIGSGICEVQEVFAEHFNLQDVKTDGSQFDQLLREGEAVQAGSIRIEVLETPGHTPACCSFLIEDRLFCGDAMFMPDSGTGRCDFPRGSATQLYSSIHDKLYKLPDSTRVYTGHDYQPGGRELVYETTIGDQKKSNIHLKESTTLQEFVDFREGRDRTLNAPRLLLQSIQLNIRAGRLPEVESNGTSYIKLPVSI